MIGEIVSGIGGSGVRAGIIGEIGTHRDFLRPAEERVFRAAARAHRETDAPISTHTFLEELIPEQLSIFEEEGVDLRRVIVGHLGDQRNLGRLREIASKGVFLQFDHIGFDVVQRDRVRAKTIATLIAEGLEPQILLSLDVCLRSRLHWHGGTGYDHVLTRFVPLLIEEGVGREVIESLLRDNPQRALAFDV